MVFTVRFIKDLAWIALLSGLFYVLTHNPIYYPKVEDVKGFYSIQLMQHPLVLGIAGHNYLVLKNDKNEIVRELHGLATDDKTGEWKYVGNKATDTLKVWEFTSSRYYSAQKNFTGVTLMQGKKENVEATWNRAERCKERINEKNIPYPPYGVNLKADTENSNSVAYTLTLCMGLDARQIGLITPGWERNLLKDSLFLENLSKGITESF